MATPVTPAQEKARRDAARNALALLAKGQPLSRKALFAQANGKLVGDYFQRDFLRRMRDQGLVAYAGDGLGKNTLYHLPRGADVSSFLNDESALTRIVFPSAAPVFSDVAETGEEPSNGAEAQEVPFDATDPAVVIKLLAAVLESQERLQSKLDALEPKINECHAMLSDLMTPTKGK